MSVLGKKKIKFLDFPGLLPIYVISETFTFKKISMEYCIWYVICRTITVHTCDKIFSYISI